MTPELITALLGAGGLAVIVPKIVDGIGAWRSGRAVEEKTKNKSLAGRLAVAETRAENEARYRRRVEEYAGGLRVRLVGLGVPIAELPPWPVRDDDPEDLE